MSTPRILKDVYKGRYYEAQKIGRGRGGEIVVDVWKGDKKEGKSADQWAFPPELPLRTAAEQGVLNCLTPEERAAQAEIKMKLTLACKLGSIVVHTEEALSKKGHQFDIEAIRPLLEDPAIKEWIKEMGVYLPKKR